MKRSYKILLVFYSIIFIALILNSFVSNILNGYRMIVFLLIIGVVFKFLFGFEKDRHRYMKDIIFEESIFLLVFFLLYYLSGIIFSFAKVGNYYNLKDMINIILPVVFAIIIKEFIRYQSLTKSEGSKMLIVITTILFILIDITVALYYNKNSTTYEFFKFIALTVLPAISSNIVYSYISIKTGYKPVIIYRLIMELYAYLLPIIPNPNEYIVSIVRLIVPILLCYRIYNFFIKDKDYEIERNYHKKRYGILLIPLSIIIFLVYITSGYFHYYALAIASNSMNPKIHKGDVVIIEKVDDNFEDIKVGQVIAYKYNDIIIVHRLVEKIKQKGSYYFYTKGDANDDIDGYMITEDMIIGIVNLKVSYVGLPTVWLNNI